MVIVEIDLLIGRSLKLSVENWLGVIHVEWWRLMLVLAIAIDLRWVVDTWGTTGRILFYSLVKKIRWLYQTRVRISDMPWRGVFSGMRSDIRCWSGWRPCQWRDGCGNGWRLLWRKVA